jgi:hypothetical protein
MPRLKWHSQAPLKANACDSFIEVRDQFRADGMELFRDHFAGHYEIRKGCAVLSRCASLAAAREWLQRRSSSTT